MTFNQALELVRASSVFMPFIHLCLLVTTTSTKAFSVKYMGAYPTEAWHHLG